MAHSIVGALKITKEGFSINGIHTWHYPDGTETIVDNNDVLNCHIIEFSRNSFTEDAGWIFHKI